MVDQCDSTVPPNERCAKCLLSARAQSAISRAAEMDQRDGRRGLRFVTLVLLGDRGALRVET